MHLSLDKDISVGFLNEPIDEVERDPVVFFPPEIALEILFRLDLPTLKAASWVNKKWRQLATDPSIMDKFAIYTNIAISNKKWSQWFAEESTMEEDNGEDWVALPRNIPQILESCCPIYPPHKIKDTHMLVWIPKTLNLNSLKELAEKHFPVDHKGYKLSIWSSFNEDQRRKLNDKSGWVLMIKSVILKSLNKTYVEQQEMVAKLAKSSLMKYQVPRVTESVACIFSQFFALKIRYFNDNPTIFTHCSDNIEGTQMIVGGFSLKGLSVSHDLFGLQNVGVAAIVWL